MAKRRHAAEQIISKLREAEVTLAKGHPLARVVRKLGITEQTYYRWRNVALGIAQRSERLRSFQSFEAPRALPRSLCIRPQSFLWRVFSFLAAPRSSSTTLWGAVPTHAPSFWAVVPNSDLPRVCHLTIAFLGPSLTYYGAAY